PRIARMAKKATRVLRTPSRRGPRPFLPCFMTSTLLCASLLVSLHVRVASEWTELARSMPAGHPAHLLFASACALRPFVSRRRMPCERLGEVIIQKRIGRRAARDHEAPLAVVNCAELITLRIERAFVS